MKEFWDERYAADEYVYGKEANLFLQSKLVGIEPGKALFRQREKEEMPSLLQLLAGM